MSRETEFKAIMIADSTLMAILTGNVYTMEEVGVEGIRRGEASPTNDAFDPDTGILRPCAVVVQGNLVPFGGLRDLKEKTMSTSQDISIYFYEFRGHAEIAAAKDRTYFLFEGERISSSFEISLINETDFFPDMGPTKNSTVMVQSWQVIAIRRPS